MKRTEFSKLSTEHQPGALIKRGQERKTNRSGDATIRALIDAAKAILIEEGISKFTIERIAKRAEVTKGTLLYHFHDKDQLLALLMSEYVAHLQQKLEESIELAKSCGRYPAGTDWTTAGFIEWYRAFRKTDASYTAFGMTILALSADNPTIRRQMTAWYEALFEKLRSSACKDSFAIVLMLEGLFYLKHLKLDVSRDDEIQKLLDRAAELLQRHH